MRLLFAGVVLTSFFPSSEADGKTPVQPSRPLRFVETEFGRSMDAGAGGISVTPKSVKQTAEGFTLQVRFRIEPRAFRFRNVLVAATAKKAERWSVFSESRADLQIALPGSLIKTEAKVSDGKWHEVHLRLTGKAVQLHLDGKEVAAESFEKKPLPYSADRIWIGQSPDGNAGFDGWIDDVLLSPGAQPVRNVWKPDGKELVWLSFEESQSDYLAQWTPLKSTRPDAETWEQETDADWTDDRFQEMNKGSLFTCSTKIPGRYLSPKSLTLLSNSKPYAVFDTKQCVLAAGFSNATLKIDSRRFGLLRMPEVVGKEVFYVDPRTAWRRANPSKEDKPIEVEFEGCCDRFGGILAYRIDGVRLLQKPGASGFGLESREGHAFGNPMHLTVFNEPGLDWEADGGWLIAETKTERVVVWQICESAGVRLGHVGSRVHLELPDREFTTNVGISRLPLSEELTRPQICCQVSSLESLVESVRERTPDEARRERIKRGLKGQIDYGSRRTPFAVDSFELPFDNVDKTLFFVTGVDFLNPETLALCTAHGDVWLVDRFSSRKPVWTRFATGLYQPLGLKVVGEDVYVLGRDQVTRLNASREVRAHFYESFNNDLVITGTPHAYATCLETDPDGNFYFFKSGKSLPHGGKLLKLSADGRKLSVFASGYRHSIGLGASPTGLITAADNQGNWIPASSIQVVEPGSFHGYMPEIHRPGKPDSFDQPMCWIPHSVDNSSGGQTWIPEGHWGPFGGKMVHFSWGQCTMHLCLMEKVDGTWQGGTIEFPGIKFDSGPIAGRFHKADDSLYVCGLDGWQTAAKQDGCLQRVRYTGRDAFMPIDLKAHEDGLAIQFTQKLDEAIATDASNYEVSQWQYRWSSAYGSPEYSVSEPNRIGHDPVTIEKVTLDADSRTVFLHIPSIRPVMQMRIATNLAPGGGKQQERIIHNTIHKLRKPRR